jgi:ubiquinone/menaquinone biosynthesis C-methylase UbiE
MDRRIKARINRELLSHEEDDILLNSYKLKNYFSHIHGYPSKKALENYIIKILKVRKDLTILDYGCGYGNNTKKYLHYSKKIIGIDISPTHINGAKKRFAKLNISKTKYEFMTMDAHSLDFDNSSFDLIIGNGIIHHLDIEKSMSEVYRVLKKDGHAIFFEPLADNPLLKLFRFLTPHARTLDESPLKSSDISKINHMYNWIAEHKFCGLIEAPVSLVTSIVFPSNPNNGLLNFAHILERFLSSRNIFNSWHQYVLLNYIKVD